MAAITLIVSGKKREFELSIINGKAHIVISLDEFLQLIPQDSSEAVSTPIAEPKVKRNTRAKTQNEGKIPARRGRKPKSEVKHQEIEMKVEE
jgi:hypothetical protein